MKEMCDKMKKILAIACILCLTFATLTAFADVTVTTTTSYDYYAANDADMTITTKVAGLDDNGEITYYVANADKIVYIDQKTAATNTVDFEFVAKKGDVLTATAKNGSDKEYTFPTFEFKDGCNLLTGTTAKVEPVTDNCKYDAETKTYIFQGVVSGNVKAYGVTIKLAGDAEATELQAMGCDENGTFAVEIQNITAEEAATVAEFAR